MHRLLTGSDGIMIKVGIVGGTGYTGAELLRLLVKHPAVKLEMISSRAEAGLRVDALFPHLRGHTDLCFTAPETAKLAQCDIVFFATPHGVAMQQAAALLEADTRIIDLSADFRLRDSALWAEHYKQPHNCPEWLEQAVYGLPERNRTALPQARLVACPGCYPTAVQLGLWPLLKRGWVDTQRLIASVASGVSGAGRQATIDTLMSELDGSVKAYAVSEHRHAPEIEQELTSMAQKQVALTFTPLLLPLVRGIHATLFAELHSESIALEQVQEAYEAHYADEPFVDVLPLGSHPETRSVRGSNVCRIAVHQPRGRNTLVVLVVIDNLVKGAAGQAVQVMNAMLGLEETRGLNAVALMP